MSRFVNAKHATLLIILAIVILALNIGVYAETDPTKQRPVDLGKVGRKVGATCDAEKAYAYLRTRTVSHYKPTINKLDPEFACRLERFFKATGNRCEIFSAVRSPLDWARTYRQHGGKLKTGYTWRQAALNDTYIAVRASGVNRYLPSYHTYGLAVDVHYCGQFKGSFIRKFKLHFPYNTKHIQCIEHPQPICRTCTLQHPPKTCSGGVGRLPLVDALRQYRGPGAPITRGGDPRQSGVGAPQGLGAFGAMRGVGGQGQPQSLWQRVWGTLFGGGQTAQMQCTPQNIQRSQVANISWACPQGSAYSIGQVTAGIGNFNTHSFVAGRGHVRPAINSTYSVQCFNKTNNLLGQGSCSVVVSDPYAGGGNSTDPQIAHHNNTSRPKLYLKPDRVEVSKGEEVNIKWGTTDDALCTLTGNDIEESSSTVEITGSGKLKHDTVFTLKCQTDKGTIVRKSKIHVI